MSDKLIIHDKCGLPVELCECPGARVTYDFNKDMFYDHAGGPMKKNLTIFAIMGWVYILLEFHMRMFRRELVGFQGLSTMSLAGWTTAWMFFIGGTSGWVIGYFNEFKVFGRTHKRILPVWVQSLFGMSAVFIIELSSGAFFNLTLGLNLWSYEGWPLNIKGQISLVYAPLWFLLCPFAIWLDDLLRFILFDEDKPLSILGVYKQLFTGK